MTDLTTNQHIAELGLNAPPNNVIGLDLLNRLEDFVLNLDLNQVRALIIHSELPHCFSAGADLHELYYQMQSLPSTKTEKELRAFIDRIHHVMNTIDLLPIPTIGVIRGICFGGGFELALTCDILIAEKSARFCFPELRLGLIPGFGGIPRLKRDVSNAVIRDLLFTGRSINAKKSHEIGLVSQIVATDSGIQVARATAKQITKFDPESASLTKQFIKRLPIELEEEKELFIKMALRPNILNTALKTFVENPGVMPYLPEETV